MSLFEVKCPMCKGTIWIDPSTGQVIDHRAVDHQKADIKEFIKSQKDRGSELENKFRKAKEEQQKRKEEMEKRFKNARDLDAPEENPLNSPFDWD